MTVGNPQPKFESQDGSVEEGREILFKQVKKGMVITVKLKGESKPIKGTVTDIEEGPKSEDAPRNVPMLMAYNRVMIYLHTGEADDGIADAAVEKSHIDTIRLDGYADLRKKK